MAAQTTQGRTVFSERVHVIKLEGISELHEGDIILDPIGPSRRLVLEVRPVPFILPLYKVRVMGRAPVCSSNIMDEVYRAEVRTESGGQEVTYLFEHTGPAFRRPTAEEDSRLREALI